MAIDPIKYRKEAEQRICDSINLIEDNDFEHFYNVNSKMSRPVTGQVGKIFYDSHINVLDYIDQIPESFLYDAEIEEIIIPNHITKINNLAFNRCNLNSITIPDSVTYIDYAAFARNRNLTEFILGVGIQNIKDNTFDECHNLKSIIYKGTRSQFKKTKLHMRKNWRKNSGIKFIKCTDGVIYLTNN